MHVRASGETTLSKTPPNPGEAWLPVPLLIASALTLALTLSACDRGLNQVAATSCDSGPTNATTVSTDVQATGQTVPNVPADVQRIRVQRNEVDIALSNQRITQDCGNRKNANIKGFGDYVALTGNCHRVVVNGWGNTIHIEATDSIEVVGDRNSLIWEHGWHVRRPAMQVEGMYNSVHRLVAAAG